jgi:iron complex outermembrane receptor protein
MIKETVLSRSIRLICVGGMAFGMHAAFAQQTTDNIQRVEVTGSRIPLANLEGTSPVAVVGAEEIQMDGVRSVENILNNLPQVFADQGGNVSNGSTGTATVNLRNFGPERTLVLVNGRRLPPGSPVQGGYAADLNQIPAGLIKRVEVLTGGASAVYGSDAVSGVVNFIMNDKFEGAQFEVNHSFYNHSQGNAVGDIVRDRGFAVPGDKDADGKISDASVLLGGNFAEGKGNATVFFSYKKEDALTQSERDFSACALGSSADGFSCSGSSTSFPGRFIDLNTGNSLTVADSAGGVRPFTNADIYNFNPLNYFQRPSERYGFNAAAHLDITDSIRAYSEFSFHDDSTVAQIAPSGLFGLDMSGANAVRFENPLLSDEWRSALGLNAPGDTADLLILRRNVEGGGRQDDIRHTSYRAVLGAKGDIGNWNYDVFAQLGRVLFQNVYLNDFSMTRSARAMNVVTDPDTGAAVCQSTLDGSDPNCVPYDIWRLGGVTPEALDYLQTPGFQNGLTSQSVIGGSVSSDLGEYGLQSPMANNGIGVAFGLERRSERLERKTDTAFSTGDLFGQGGATLGVDGRFTVNEVFGEVRVPLMEKRPFAHLLSANASYRYSDYDTSAGNTDSYGLGLDWAPVEQAKFRASYQRAVRAPNVIELFSPQRNALYDNDADPCAGTTPTATFEQCARTGVTAAQYGNILDNPAGQYNQLIGGNPNLSPETADTYTLGLVLSPMRNLGVTLDYFHMKVEDVIGQAPPTTSLNQCLETGNSAFCDLINRDSLGTLWALPTANILATDANLSKWETSGLDISSNYVHRLNNYGNLSVDFTGTWLKEFKQEPLPGLGTYDCKGLYGPTCGTPLPEWRHKLRTTWSTPWNVDVALTWRHIDEVTLDRTSSNPLLTGNVNEVDRKLSARNYLDIATSWPVTKQVTLRAGINNLLDKDPPVSAQVGAGFGNGNTYPQVYDALGRRIFLSATAKF